MPCLRCSIMSCFECPLFQSVSLWWFSRVRLLLVGGMLPCVTRFSAAEHLMCLLYTHPVSHINMRRCQPFCRLSIHRFRICRRGSGSCRENRTCHLMVHPSSSTQWTKFLRLVQLNHQFYTIRSGIYVYILIQIMFVNTFDFDFVLLLLHGHYSISYICVVGFLLLM